MSSTTIADLLMKLSFKGDSAVVKIGKSENAAKKLEQTVKTSSANASKALNGLGSGIPGLSKGMSMLSSVGIDLGKTLGGAGVTQVAAVAGVALGTLAGYVGHGAQLFAQMTGEVTAFQRVAGGTAENASRMVALMKDLGVDTDAGAKAMFRFGTIVNDTPEKLTRLGVSIARNKNGSVDLVGTLENLGTAYQHATSAAEKDAIAKDALGRQGLALLPILGKNREELEKFFAAAKNRNEIFSQADLQKGAEFRISMRELHSSMQGLEMTVGKEVVPALIDFDHAATTLIDHTTGWAKHIGGIGHVLKAAFAIPLLAAGPAGQAVLALADSHDKAKDAAEKQSAQEAELESQLQKSQQAEDADSAALKTLRDDALGVVQAKDRLAAAHDGVTKAERSQASAQRDLTALLRAGKVDTEAVAAAQRSAAADALTYKRAQQGLTQALADFEHVKLGPTARDTEEARLGLSDATNAQTAAELRAIQAARKLKELQSSGTASADELEQARLDLSDAGNAQEHADLAAADAQQRLSDTQAMGTPGSQAYKDAQQKVSDAQDSVAAASDRAAESAKKLALARQGDPDFDQKVADKRQAVADATDAIKSAQDNVASTALAFADAEDKAQTAIGRGSDRVSELKANLDQLVAAHPELAALVGSIDTTLALFAGQSAPSGPKAFPSGGRARAGGGRVYAGESYRVGELGSEEFTPTVDGMITAHGATSGAGGDLVLTVPVVLDGREIARASVRYTQAELLKIQRANTSTGIR